MPTSTIGVSTIGGTQVAATAVTGWSSSTPCGFGVLVSLPTSNTGTIYYGFLTGVTTSTGIPIPTGVPYTINPAGLIQSQAGGVTPTLSNLFFIASGSGQAFTAEAIG